jgi:hypothetical protein
MDDLIAKYNTPHDDYFGPEDEHTPHLISTKPSLKHNFALPPIAQVHTPIFLCNIFPPWVNMYQLMIARRFPPCANGRPLESRLSHQACPRHHHPCFQIPRWDHRSYGFPCNAGKLDRFTDCQKSH